MQVFENDDNAYLEYMEENPSCFIVNTHRRRSTSYSVLHRSKCTHVSTTSGLTKGAYTERNYIKVCSNDLNELHKWFVLNRPSFTGGFHECGTCNPFSKKFVDNPVFLFPDTIEQEEEILTEGAKTKVTVNAYERNAKARELCLQHHGYSCSVCQINFEDTYGIIGRDFIHVHHLKEISEIGDTYVIDPFSDLKPVCPNCHAMLHQRKPCFTIEELIDMFHEGDKQLPITATHISYGG